MNLVDFIIIGAIALVVLFAVLKIIRDKKNGSKCIGCSSSNCKNKNC